MLKILGSLTVLSTALEYDNKLKIFTFDRIYGHAFAIFAYVLPTN